MIDKSTLLDTPEARAEAYDKIAACGWQGGCGMLAR
jgi:hypothetical protein